MTNEREHRIEYQIHTKLYMWFMHASTPTTLTFMQHFSYMWICVFSHCFFQLSFLKKFQKNNNMHNSCKEHAQQPSTTLHMEFFSFIHLFSYLQSNSFDPIAHLEHFKSAITDIYFVQHFYFRFGIMGYSFFSLSSYCVYNTIRK